MCRTHASCGARPRSQRCDLRLLMHSWLSAANDSAALLALALLMHAALPFAAFHARGA